MEFSFSITWELILIACATRSVQWHQVCNTWLEQQQKLPSSFVFFFFNYFIQCICSKSGQAIPDLSLFLSEDAISHPNGILLSSFSLCFSLCISFFIRFLPFLLLWTVTSSCCSSRWWVNFSFSAKRQAKFDRKSGSCLKWSSSAFAHTEHFGRVVFSFSLFFFYCHAVRRADHLHHKVKDNFLFVWLFLWVKVCWAAKFWVLWFHPPVTLYSLICPWDKEKTN